MNANDPKKAASTGKRLKLHSKSVLPQAQASDSPAIALFNNKLYVVYQYNAGLYYMTLDLASWNPQDTPQWTDPVLVPNVGINGAPGVAVYRGQLYVAHRGAGGSDWLWYPSCDENNNWSTDHQIQNVLLSESPAVGGYQGQLFIAHQGSATTNEAGSIWYTASEDGTTWNPDYMLPNLAISGSPSLAVLEDKMYLAYQGRDKEGKGNGQLLYSTYSGGDDWETQPPISEVTLAGSPALGTYVPDVGKQVLFLFYRNYIENSNSGLLFYTRATANDPDSSGPAASWSPGKAAEDDDGPVEIFGSPSIAVSNDAIGGQPNALRVYCVYLSQDTSNNATSPIEFVSCVFNNESSL